MIQETLKRFGIEPHKFYTISDLHEVMVDLGLTNMNRSSFTNDFINRKIEKGVLVLPPRAEKNQMWRLTGAQIEQIVLAFAPGGIGYYDYQDELSSTENPQ